MSEGPVHNGLVLLLEDEALVAVALQADLEDAGYTVAGPFTTSASALDWLADHKPDLAILDTVVKDGPCKDVALKLTSLGVPFLVHSGHAKDPNTPPELADAAWVDKPATAQVLLAALAGLKGGAATPG